MEPSQPIECDSKLLDVHSPSNGVAQGEHEPVGCGVQDQPELVGDLRPDQHGSHGSSELRTDTSTPSIRSAPVAQPCSRGVDVAIVHFLHEI